MNIVRTIILGRKAKNLNFSIRTSYFYQIRHFKPNMIPISTCLSDPKWFRPKPGEQYYLDKRGVACGIRYEPLIVQGMGEHVCPCEEKTLQGQCPVMQEYLQSLNKLDKEEILKAFEHCANYLKKKLNFQEEPIIVLIVYEAPDNPCSERAALQEFFNCEELTYPI